MKSKSYNTRTVCISRLMVILTLLLAVLAPLGAQECWDFFGCGQYEQDCGPCAEAGGFFPCGVQIDPSFGSDIARQEWEGWYSYNTQGPQVLCYQWGGCPIDSSDICYYDPETHETYYQCVTPVFWFYQNTYEQIIPVGEPNCTSD